MLRQFLLFLAHPFLRIFPTAWTVAKRAACVDSIIFIQLPAIPLEWRRQIRVNARLGTRWFICASPAEDGITLGIGLRMGLHLGLDWGWDYTAIREDQTHLLKAMLTPQKPFLQAFYTDHPQILSGVLNETLKVNSWNPLWFVLCAGVMRDKKDKLLAITRVTVSHSASCPRQHHGDSPAQTQVLTWKHEIAGGGFPLWKKK